jgi:hypothetical protein
MNHFGSPSIPQNDRSRPMTESQEAADALADTGARVGAALRVWSAAAIDGDGALDLTSASQLQCAMTAIVAVLTSAVDATPSRVGASDLPLHQARDMLGVVERALCAFDGGFIAAAPAREDLVATAEMAAELLTMFTAASHISNYTDASRDSGAQLIQ